MTQAAYRPMIVRLLLDHPSSTLGLENFSRLPQAGALDIAGEMVRTGSLTA